MKSFSLLILNVLLLSIISPISAQENFTIEQILSVPFPYDLISAKSVDRIAWIENERGRRNVFTAAAPDFKPVQLTRFLADDGTDLSNLCISDNGEIIVFVRGHSPNRDGWIANPSSLPDGSERAIWGVRTSGGEPWRIAKGTNPILSPNGRWILFEKDDEIYEVPVEKSASIPFDRPQLKPLFRTHGRNRGFCWSPNSRKIAFVSDRGDHSYIGIYHHETRKITYCAPGVDKDDSPTWSPDSRKVAFIRKPGATIVERVRSRQSIDRERRSNDQIASAPGFQEAALEDGHKITFWFADSETGAGRKFWHDPLGDSTFLDIRRLNWAGDHILFRLERNNWQHYYTVPISNDPDFIPIDLTPGEGIAEFVGVSKDGKYLFYSTNVGDINRRHIWKTPTKGGKSIQLTKGDGIETYPTPLASDDELALMYADAKQPLSVAIVSTKGSKPKIIAPHLPDDFPLKQQVIPQNVILTAADSLEFHNQLFVPRNIRAGERKPAILFTHGGPRRQMLLGYHYRSFYHTAYAINQYFANQGYVVISVNYRSGIGYGREFRMAKKRGRHGASEYQDVIAAGTYLQSRPDVDPERIGLWGLSYGGYLTAMGLSRNSDIFAAGVDMAGVHLWSSSLDTSSVSFKSSPVATIEKWTSPVLLIHGDDDRNVSFSHTTSLVQLLRANKIYHEIIVFPDDVHSFLIFDRWIKTFHATENFFERFLKKKQD